MLIRRYSSVDNYEDSVNEMRYRDGDAYVLGNSKTSFAGDKA